MAFTTNQWIILLLVLVLGWLLGLVSRSGGGKWRAQAEAERVRADVARSEASAAEARAAAAEQRIETSDTRIAELERNARPVGVGTAASVAAAASGRRDDLSLIRGIGHDGEVRLNEAGFHRFDDLARMSDAEAATLEGQLGATPGTVARGEWREQAAELARDPAAHRARFGY